MVFIDFDVDVVTAVISMIFSSEEDCLFVIVTSVLDDVAVEGAIGVVVAVFINSEVDTLVEGIPSIAVMWSGDVTNRVELMPKVLVVVLTAV